jgi:hypothetical protein
VIRGTSACTFIDLILNSKARIEKSKLKQNLSNLSEKFREIVGGFQFTDAFTATNLTGLDHDRKSDPLCPLETF